MWSQQKGIIGQKSEEGSFAQIYIRYYLQSFINIKGLMLNMPPAGAALWIMVTMSRSF